jgi:hypothetical protein
VNTILTGTPGLGGLQAAKRWIWVVRAAGRRRAGRLIYPAAEPTRCSPRVRLW